MEPKRLTTRARLQRVVNLTKHAHELQSPTNLAVPFWSAGWHRQASTNSDTTQAGGGNQSPRNGPTYALAPTRKFDFSRVQRAFQLELNRRCSRISRLLHYEPKQCLDLTRDLSQQLRRVLKPEMLNNTRYKVVVIVNIVQLAPDRQNHQAIALVSRCLWNCETDGSITVQAKLGYDMVAIAIAFVVYTD